jgi:hypothetical protein
MTILTLVHDRQPSDIQEVLNNLQAMSEAGKLRGLSFVVHYDEGDAPHLRDRFFVNSAGSYFTDPCLALSSLIPLIAELVLRGGLLDVVIQKYLDGDPSVNPARTP